MALSTVSLSRGLALLVTAVLGGIGIINLSNSAAQEGLVIPPPAMDTAASGATTEIAVLAAGCFWGVQGVFQHVEGVGNAVSGYAGGDMKSARYDLVGNGRTGHAEAVKVTFDPRKISYGRILQIYFSVAHDPTQLNRQGPDVGPQYRSTIFPVSAEQEKVARAYIAQLDQARVYRKRIATTLETGKFFFPAEDYHQDFLARNPRHRYIVINDLPKIENLKRLFPAIYRPEPVLVATASKSN
jgi:peptide-methionine (S)-S-oxide reductase